MNKVIFAQLFGRDLERLYIEIEKYPSEVALWAQLPGTTNSGGNLCQHLIGNLRTFVCRTLGGFDYVRDRDAEFNQRVFSQKELLEQLRVLTDMVSKTVEKLDDDELEADYPREVVDLFPEQSVRLILTHLALHLSYHLGQINYHRRWITQVQSAQQ
ncbi:DinB family protein [Dyadobacter sp. MSC1_007]|jgi:uncharacterized damage-inducible protein DinB|uniref:DinB family protein n=1 Tax=Dyadobacter sp. MSC1_007 TaxID=2909264 RepID=UPI00202DC429|nr:DUF1572 family protein [Dyadobacter sp. MSC1_007]